MLRNFRRCTWRNVMMTAVSSCPSTDRLRQLLTGAASDAVLVDLTAHVGECRNCQRRLEQLSGASPAFLDSPAFLRHTDYREEAPIRRLLAHLGSDRSAAAWFGAGPVPGILAPGLFLGLTGGSWPSLLPDLLVSLIALLALVWLYGTRSTLRRDAVLTAYAEREIARSLHKKTAPAGVPSSGRTNHI
jgi:hypothetical protein